ncbi:uncharacterized protein [Primulina huaijiensis]|uniref:uncharacterized protein isoform X2 n=1 Tax=Primulina huaijiensis TaxID=1492673 RepID=UPI003CC6E4CA
MIYAHNGYTKCDLIGDPLEIAAPNNLILQEQNSVKTLKLSSIDNWLQCQDFIKGLGGVNGTICGKRRRAPLFEVQTDGWGCFDSVNRDPTHSDCVVPQES